MVSNGSRIFIITILILFIAGGSAYLTFSQKTDAPSFEGKIHEVNLRDDGYTPKELDISLGDAVKFTTSRDEFFWPASNLHPTHEIYPEFDPRKPIGSNESWVFRFEKSGEWRYHDHLNPFYTGVIKVIR